MAALPLVAFAAASYASYASRAAHRRALRGLDHLRDGVQTLDTVLPGAIPFELRHQMSVLSGYANSTGPLAHDVACAYCGRPRAYVFRTRNCEGCGAVETR